MPILCPQCGADNWPRDGEVLITCLQCGAALPRPEPKPSPAPPPPAPSHYRQRPTQPIAPPDELPVNVASVFGWLVIGGVFFCAGLGALIGLGALGAAETIFHELFGIVLFLGSVQIALLTFIVGLLIARR